MEPITRRRLSQEVNAAKNESLMSTIEQINQLQSSFPYQAPSAMPIKPAYFGAAKGKNLIIVQMKAFQNFPIHLSLNGQVLTPVLNGLMNTSMYFPHVFQQIGQGNTSDAEFMSNTSIYLTGTIVMSMGYGHFKSALISQRLPMSYKVCPRPERKPRHSLLLFAWLFFFPASLPPLISRNLSLLFSLFFIQLKSAIPYSACTYSVFGPSFDSEFFILS
jgi:hypothetical protein